MVEKENPYEKIIADLEKEIKIESERLEILRTIYLKQITWYAHLTDLAGSRKLRYTPSIYLQIPFYLEDDIGRYNMSSSYKKDNKRNLKNLIDEINSTGKHINELNEELNLKQKCMAYYNTILGISDENLKIKMFSLIADISINRKVLDDVVSKLGDFLADKNKS